MKFNKEILTEIANQIDLINTINGGVSMTSVNVVQEDDHFIIKVKTPGINKFAYHVELTNNKILIYTLIKVDKRDSEVEIPSFVQYFPIPNDVNGDDIQADFEDGELKVKVPFNNDQEQKVRKIEIKYL
jgi:HSP20 family protein